MGLATNRSAPTDTCKVFDNNVYRLQFYYLTIHAASLEMATHELARRESYLWFHRHVKEPNYIVNYDVSSDSFIYRFYGYMKDEDLTFYRMKYG